MSGGISTELAEAHMNMLMGVMFLGRREYDRRRDAARKLQGLLWCDWSWVE